MDAVSLVTAFVSKHSSFSISLSVVVVGFACVRTKRPWKIKLVAKSGATSCQFNCRPGVDEL